MVGGGVRAASSGGTIWWTAAVVVALFVGLTIKGGKYYVGGSRTIDRSKQPALFWALTAILGAIVMGFVCLAVWADLRFPLYLPQP